jgi:hypothetical protein
VSSGSIGHIGEIVVLWPEHTRADAPYAAWGVEVRNARSGEPITTITHLAVLCLPDDLITARVRMFTDAEGNPVFDGQPVLDGDGGIHQGEFTFLVTGMEVREKVAT